MLRSLVWLFVQFFVMPVLAGFGTICTLVYPPSEMVPRVARAWARMTLRTMGVRVRFVGEDRLHATRPAVAVSNHTSAVDIYLFCAYLPIPFRMVSKASLFRIPVFGWALRAAGFVPLERSGGRRDIERLAGIRWDRARRAVIGFYPEGTRSRTGRMGRFKKGAFVTAIREQIPVLPIAIEGAHRVQPSGAFRFRPGEVVVRVLEPIPTLGMTDADRDRLCRMAEERIATALPEEQRPQPATAGPG